MSSNNSTGYPNSNPHGGDLLEFSVVYTDRAINLMSKPFQGAMNEISSTMKSVYNADHCAVIPGSGTYAMEAVARQFGTGKKCLVVRNGFFSFRWSDIFECCGIPSEEIVLKARVSEEGNKPHMTPVPAQEVADIIRKEKPQVVFAPHVETATGIILPDEYLKTVAQATHEVGGLFVLDAIAAGTLWADMKELGVDCLITAPQKGWSGPACCGIVMMNDNAKEICETGSKPTSFSCNLLKWLKVMQAYESGGFMYYTTLPTDSLYQFSEIIKETKASIGFQDSKKAAIELGTQVRAIMKKYGLKSVAPEGFEAPTVIVCYSDSPLMVAKFKEQGIQIAGGVPFKCDEPEGLVTFRIGLFGLDKMRNVSQVAATFDSKLGAIMQNL